ncbi:hypothetical protein M378DRAFT_739778 [Amanita muscaria Koide BX008]|uniref:Uncharacterized protein n=1 Tax=Amanita muscaria (strain Koide BX008) TaxID=946122 RepID=A0A0C2X1B2_AMAMK|nr:hypothetical protein M378DRAFT_739778 [Amanita muscaria Koide BX008]
MSAPSSNSPSDSITCGCLNFPIFTRAPPRKRPFTASRPQSVDRFTEDVRDPQSREAGDGSDPGVSIISPLPSQVPPIISTMNRGNGNTQSGEAEGGLDPDLPIPTAASTVATETRSITFFQEASNVQMSNTHITAIGGNATIIRFGDGQFTDVQRNLVRRICACLSKHNSRFVDL